MKNEVSLHRALELCKIHTQQDLTINWGEFNDRFIGMSKDLSCTKGRDPEAEDKVGTVPGSPALMILTQT